MKGAKGVYSLALVVRYHPDFAITIWINKQDL
jgi:hypothetical protein